ncbi:MAG: hypothetical protein JXA52_07100, partial [Planctomycetes bacterium]|nr:hypothetical protein [Planctomycetota bacterium]
AVRRVYLLEGLGAVCGGICLTLLFWAVSENLIRFTSVWILFAASAVLSLLAAAISWPERSRLKVLMRFACLVIAAGIIVFTPEMATRIDHLTLPWRYPEMELLPAEEASWKIRELKNGQMIFLSEPAGSLILQPDDPGMSKEELQVSRAYLNGHLLYEREDIFSRTEKLFLPALCVAKDLHSQERVIVDCLPTEKLIAGIRALNPDQPATTTFLIQNESMFKIYRENPSAFSSQEFAYYDGSGQPLADSLAEIVYESKQYDLIILDKSPPETAATNRFYTIEHFLAMQKMLAPGGVYSFTLPASRNRTDASLARYLAVVTRSAEAIFKHVRIYPGLYAGNIVCCSDSPLPDGATLAKRSREYKIESRELPAAFLKTLDTSLHSERLEKAIAAVGKLPLNTRFHPVAPLYAYFAHEQRIEGKAQLAPLLLKVQPWQVAVAVTAGFVIILAIMLFAGGKTPRKKNLLTRSLPVILAAGVSGFVNLLFASVLILVLQLTSGEVYLLAGLLVAGFMAGLTLGAILLSDKHRSTAGALAAWLLLTGIIILIAVPIFNAIMDSGRVVAALMLPGLNMLMGFMAANVFLRANRLRGNLGPGVMFASDLFGSGIGGLLGGALLLPLLGVQAMCITAACLCLAVSVIIMVGRPG